MSLVGSIVTHRCLGIFDPALAPLLLASIPPEFPGRFECDRAFRYCVATIAESSISISIAPDVPPP